MGLFDGWMICSDFDGTLYVGGAISEQNAKAIAYFQREGGYFTFSSGRMPRMLDSISTVVCANAPIITMNGSLICDLPDADGVRREIYRGALRSAEILDYVLDLYARMESVTKIVAYYDKTSATLSKKDAGRSAAEFAAGIPENVLKVILCVEAQSAPGVYAKMREELGGRFSVTRSWVCGIEVNAGEDTKGAGVLRVKKLLGAEHLVCVGDYHNDIDMIVAADLGYAVGDAVPELIAVADRVTVPAAEHALAHIVADVAHACGASLPEGIL